MEAFVEQTPDFVFEITNFVDPIAEKIMSLKHSALTHAEKAFNCREIQLSTLDALYVIGVNLFNKPIAALSPKHFKEHAQLRDALFTLASEDLLSGDRNHQAKSALLTYAAFGKNHDLVVRTTFFLHNILYNDSQLSNLSLLQALSNDPFIARFGHYLLAISNNPRYQDYCDLINKNEPGVESFIKLLKENRDIISMANFYADLKCPKEMFVPELDLFHRMVAEVSTPSGISHETLKRISKHFADDSPFFRELCQGFTISFNKNYLNKAVEIFKKDRDLRISNSCSKIYNYHWIADFFQEWKVVDKRLREFIQYNHGNDALEDYKKEILPTIDELAISPVQNPGDKPVKPSDRRRLKNDDPPKEKAMIRAA